MKIRAACCSFALIACLGLPAIVQAQKTSYDFDRSTNFSKFKTFELVKGTPQSSSRSWTSGSSQQSNLGSPQEG